VERSEVQAMFERMFQVMDPEWEYEQRHPEFVADMPQSNERLPSREALLEMQRAFGPPPAIEMRRLTGEGDTWVVEAHSDYGPGGVYQAVVIFEFRDGLIVRETRYYTQPFDAPAERAQWVVPIPD
jgi:hypothetical protein